MVKYRGLAYFKGPLVKAGKKCLKIIFSWRKEDLTYLQNWLFSDMKIITQTLQ